jgi:hypothetical protein
MRHWRISAASIGLANSPYRAPKFDVLTLQADMAKAISLRMARLLQLGVTNLGLLIRTIFQSSETMCLFIYGTYWRSYKRGLLTATILGRPQQPYIANRSYKRFIVRYPMVPAWTSSTATASAFVASSRRQNMYFLAAMFSALHVSDFLGRTIRRTKSKCTIVP